QPQPSYPTVFGETFRFSPDGKRFGYLVSFGTAAVPGFSVVIDGQRGPHFDAARLTAESRIVSFSPDGKHVAYALERKGHSVAVIDGVEGKGHPGQLSPEGIVWSPDSRRWAMAVRGEAAANGIHRGFVVTDDKADQAFDGIASLHMSSETGLVETP